MNVGIWIRVGGIKEDNTVSEFKDFIKLYHAQSIE